MLLIMDKKLFQIFSLLTFIALKCSAEDDVKLYDEQKFYDIGGLITKITRDFQNSMLLRTYQPLDNLQLGSSDEDFEFKSLNFQFHSPLQQNVSKCFQDLLYMEKNIKSEWGLRMIDSYGKPESGIMDGNVRWPGDYNECVGIRVSNPDSNSTMGNFRGKYCSLTWSLKSLNLSMPISFVSGVCVPDSCTAEELQEYALQLLRMAGILPAHFNGSTNSLLNADNLKCKPTERHLNAAAKTIIVVLSLFCALTVLGSSVTVVRYFQKMIEESRTPSNARDINDLVRVDENGVPDNAALLQDSETPKRDWKKLESFLLCFCMFTNGAKLLNTSPSEGELLCIHGIRFLSMSWVIMGHTYAFGYGQMKNMAAVFKTLDTFPFQAVLQAFYSVDSFFVLSGFLLTYLAMKEFSKTKGKIAWPYFYIHRYLRLTPMYMILVAFSATAYLYLGSGPYWPDGDYDAGCKKLWWWNLLYINNFNIKDGQCFGPAWYLANDMQFFIISPLFLITLWRWPIIGYCLLSIFLLASCLSNFIITYHFDLGNGLITFLHHGMGDMVTVMQKFMDYFDYLYVKPYTRIGPYLVGIFTGYILFRRKASNAPKHSLVFLTVGWIIASFITLDTVYGMYHTDPNLVARSFYNALSRICWAGGLCWVIYVCLMGQGGFINSLLSFKLFIPLSRLTYAAYLIHPMVISGYLGTQKSSLEFSHTTLVTLFLGFMLVTYALSLPVSLILESPIVALEKLIRKGFTKEQKKEAVN